MASAHSNRGSTCLMLKGERVLLSVRRLVGCCLAEFSRVVLGPAATYVGLVNMIFHNRRAPFVDAPLQAANRMVGWDGNHLPGSSCVLGAEPLVA
jgi:hypothetical protein